MALFIDKPTMVLLFGEQELIQLTDRHGVTGAIVDEVLDRAMATADSEASSYVGAAYKLPLPSVPDVLKTFTADIARYYLYDEQATEQVTKRYERAISWLKDVVRGVVNLGFTDSASEPAESSVVVVSSRPQVFSNERFTKMGPSWNL